MKKAYFWFFLFVFCNDVSIAESENKKNKLDQLFYQLKKSENISKSRASLMMLIIVSLDGLF